MRRLAAILLVGAGAMALVVWQLQQGPEGPRPVSWDEASCAHCQMHVGEPRFAAQLQTAGGEVHNFDDHGCLFEYVAGENPRVRAAYFRHHRRQAWLSRGEVRFVEVDEPTPMGYGLAAVGAAHDSPGRSYEEAFEAITSRETSPDARRHRHDEETHR